VLLASDRVWCRAKADGGIRVSGAYSLSARLLFALLKVESAGFGRELCYAIAMGLEHQKGMCDGDGGKHGTRRHKQELVIVKRICI
jgi:hypothetical protein